MASNLEDIKTILRSLLISSPRTLTVEDLRREYRNLESRECPLLGYRNFTEFLQSLPDVVTVLSNGVVRPVATKETVHIQQLVALQKKPKAKIRRYGRSSSYSRPELRRYVPAPRYNSSSRYEPPPRFRPRENLPSPSYTMEDHFARVREAKEAVRRNERSLESAKATINPTFEADEAQPRRPQYVPEVESSDDSEDSFYERFKDHSNDSSGKEDTVLKKKRAPLASVPSERKSSTGLETYFEYQSSTVSDKMKCNLRNLIQAYPSGLWACLLPEKYEEEFGVHLNWNELGFDSVVQMAHDLLDIFVCKRVEGGDWMLFDAGLPLPSEHSNEHTKKKVKPDPIVPDVVKRRMYDIVKKFTSGIRAEQLAQLYSEHYGTCLSYDAPGFNDVESLLVSIQDTIIHLRYIRKECYVYPADQPKSKELVLPAIAVDTETKKQLKLYPEEVMGAGDIFSSPHLPANVEEGGYIELRVAEVYSPYKFFIILREKYGELERLMDELQDFYLDHGSNYVMPGATITEGICCAALYSGEWHRCCVKSVDQEVEVYYVDYGTVAKVARSELRFLHKDFNTLPAQAIRATLCGIQPASGRSRFTREANQAFLSLVSDRNLIGLAQRIDPQEPYLELFLIDTNGVTDVHLNDALVTMEHASFRPDLLEVSDILEENQSQDQTSESMLIEQPLRSTTPEQLQDPEVATHGKTDTSMLDYSASQPEVSASIPSLPPPGFSAVPSVSTPLNMSAGFGMNPYFAAAYLQQMNAAALMQQQQLQQQQLQQQQINQQLLLAYYANLLQPATAQSVASVGPWLGAQSQMQQPLSNPQNTNQFSAPKDSSSRKHGEASHDSSLVSDGQVKRTLASQMSQRNSSDNLSKLVILKEDSSSSSNRSNNYSSRKKKTSKKKRSDPRPTTPSNCKIRANLPLKNDSDNVSSRLSTCPITNKKTSRQDCLLLEPVTSDSGEDIAIDHLDDLRAHTDSSLLSSSSSSCLVAPDLVQSVGNVRISSYSPISNFWKVADVSGKSIHLFNIEGKAFVSTGELSKKFTDFSTCDILVRVLKNKDFVIPYKKLMRQEGLPLFSALDGCDDEVIKCFDLSRGKNGSVIGSFHLTPLLNTPMLIITLGIDVRIAREFQRLRDQFDPNDSFWIQ